MLSVLFHFNKAFFLHIFVWLCLPFTFYILVYDSGIVLCSLSATNLSVTNLGRKKTLNTLLYFLSFSHSSFHDTLISMSLLFQKFFPLYLVPITSVKSELHCQRQAFKCGFPSCLTSCLSFLGFGVSSTFLFEFPSGALQTLLLDKYKLSVAKIYALM